MENYTQPYVLVVDDDEGIRDLLSAFLLKHQLRVDVAENAEQADIKLRKTQYDLMVLDLMMPGEDGLDYCKRLRQYSFIPIIMLTAMGDETDRIVGLEIGADDYLPKPFSPRELLARIRALIRRRTYASQENGLTNHSPGVRYCYLFADWIFNPQTRELHTKSGVLVSLTSAEFDLLHCFLDHAQIVLNREQLLDLTKGRDAVPFDRSIDVQLSRLRQKVETDPRKPILIKTVRNSGYVLSVKVDIRPCE